MMPAPRSCSSALCRRGSTVILTMIFLVLFGSLAVAFSAATNMNLRQAANYSNSQNAQMAAESGLAFILDTIATLGLAADDADADLLLTLANALAPALDGTHNLNFGGIDYDGAEITIPTVALNDSQSFQTRIALGDDGLPLITVTGLSGGSTRRVQMRLEKKQVPSHVFDYGVASKGKILVGGDGTISGANFRSEADVLSATYSDQAAIEISGSCQIDGDLFTANPDSYVRITGNPTVGGDTHGDIIDHIHIGVGDVAFPEIDTSPFKPFATNIIGPSTPIPSGAVLQNVRILPGTNPTFSGDVTIEGVLYVEQPNTVKFTGGANITGMIATDDAGDGNYSTNVLEFQGNVHMDGVESLPDTPQYHDLRELAGAAILAPGFSVKMTGSFDTISGAMAADQFTITGNTSGTINGPVVCYGDTEFTIWGSSHLNIDRSKYGDVLPGFKNPVRLVADADSYVELK